MDTQTARQNARSNYLQTFRDSRERREIKKLACAQGGLELRTVAVSSNSKLVPQFLTDLDLVGMAQQDYISQRSALGAA